MIRFTLSIALISGIASPAMAGSALQAKIENYRHCVEVRSVVSPRIFASEGERSIGAAVDCVRHHGDTLKTVMSPPAPVPRLLRSPKIAAAVSRLLHAHHSSQGE